MAIYIYIYIYIYIGQERIYMYITERIHDGLHLPKNCSTVKELFVVL